MIKNKITYFDILKDIISKRDDIIPNYIKTNQCCLINRKNGKYIIDFMIPKGIHQFNNCIRMISNIEARKYKKESNILLTYFFYKLKIQYYKEYNINLEDDEIEAMINMGILSICKALYRKYKFEETPDEILDFYRINKKEWLEKIKHNYVPFITPIKTDWTNCKIEWNPKNGLIDQLNLVLNGIEYI